MDRADLIGTDVLINGEITFRPGVLLKAIRTPNAIILFDEPSSARPQDLIILHAILDGSGDAVVPQTGEPMTVAPGVAFIICDNLNGAPDREGRYPGLGAMSAAFCDRFGVFVKFDYLTVAQESAVLRKRVKTLDKETATNMARLSQASRKLATVDQLPEAAVSHRQLVAWARLIGAGLSVEDAFAGAVLGRHNGDVAEALLALYRNQWGMPTPDESPADAADVDGE